MPASSRKIGWILAAILYVVAGTLHFLHPGVYVRIIPPFIPQPEAMVWISGMAEIAGGIGLLIRPLRRAAAWGLVALLVAVFPANIYMAASHIQVTDHPLPGILLWARLPLQFVLIWWVLWATT